MSIRGLLVGVLLLQPWLSGLPNQPLTETIRTQKAEPVDVQIVRVSSTYLQTLILHPAYESLPTDARVVAHFVSVPDAGTRGLSHTIILPPLETGAYDVRLATPQRIGFQVLLIGTLGLMVNRTFESSVAMPIDLRTFRIRHDVVATLYTENGPHALVPGDDGLFRFAFPWTGSTAVSAPTGTIVATAADGSAAVVPFGWTISAWNPVYSETDRYVYKPGDTVFARFVSRYDDPPEQVLYFGRFTERDNAIYQLSHFKQHVAGHATILPSSASTGIYRLGGIAVADAAHSRYEMEAAALTPSVKSGEMARFVISVMDHRGIACEGVRVRYAWHETNYPASLPVDQRPVAPSEDITYGTAASDRFGNVVVTTRMQRRDVEVYAYDPDDGQIAASARARPVPAPQLATVSGHSEVLAVTADRPMASCDGPMTFTARSTTDGDALVYYGSGLHFRSTTARFVNGVAHFTLAAPCDDDDFRVSVALASSRDRQGASTIVHAHERRHLLDVRVTCAERAALPSHRVRFCVDVRDWRANGEPARLLVTVRYATAAALANIEADAPVLYETLYEPQVPNQATIQSWTNQFGGTPVSYLYPESSPSPLPVVTQHLARARGLDAPDLDVRVQGWSQTIVWDNRAHTERDGTAVITVNAPERRGEAVLLHVIALTDGGGVGEANAWLR